jgi:hypothetical protein
MFDPSSCCITKEFSCAKKEGGQGLSGSEVQSIQLG